MSRLVSKKITLKNNDLPVSLEEVKAWLRVDFDENDGVIESLIRSSVSELHEYLRRVIVPASVQAWYKQEECGDTISLSFSDNIQLTGQSISDFGDSLFGDSLLTTEETEVRMTYDAGYDEVPEWFKTAIKLNVAWKYENRGDEAGTMMNTATINHLKPYVNWSFL